MIPADLEVILVAQFNPYVNHWRHRKPGLCKRKILKKIIEEKGVQRDCEIEIAISRHSSDSALQPQDCESVERGELYTT
ncbi:hypothetical protein EVAR_25250_1 [Eumeta japonica]|uniref:Uncharacterized protein n=1 Tax=Eumeta variegata TaxID=151549 RepID=A0A4C1VMR2_EUMVA|nr:hypothetical protein EVAR_25250_1 [Eumeta japonica]